MYKIFNKNLSTFKTYNCKNINKKKHFKVIPIHKLDYSKRKVV